MKSVFRKSALDKISSPDQLDKVLKVTSPLSWLALLGVTLIIVFAVVWSFTGSLPSTVTASGVIVSADTPTNTILATRRGSVQQLAREGARIYQDSKVMEMATDSGTEYVTSNLLGTVSKRLVGIGETVENGKEILRVAPAMTGGQSEIAVCYVPVTDADKIRRGMEANVTLTSADSSSYGHMTARVINVDAWATSDSGIAAVVGNDNSMVGALKGDGKGVVAVSLELMTDPNTVSGYAWSNDKGKKVALVAPQMCSVRIVTERERPITKLFAKLKDIWENK